MTDKTIELWEKLTQLQQLLHRRRFYNRGPDRPTSDTTRGQGRILAFLKLKDGIPTKDLSYLLNIRISSLNELLMKLEKNGYITREPSETDKRILLIRLTEKGRTEEQPEPDVSSVFNCLSPEEQETFGAYLDRIIAALEAEPCNGDPRHCEEHRRQRREAFERCFNGEGSSCGRRGRPGGFHNGPGCNNPGFGRPKHSGGPSW